MKITFYGAAGEVTGSCTLVETKKTKFLVDCGMFQGSFFAQEKNFYPFEFNPQNLDFVLLTHAHIDHCGRLPLLIKNDFRGKIYCTPATKDLSEIILLDAAKVIKEEAIKYHREILYREKDVIQTMSHFWGIDYGVKQRLSSDVTIRFRDAGHILGSAIIEIWVKDGLKNKKIVFSGDLGNYPAPIVRDTEMIEGANIVIVESTYGGRIHEPSELRTEILRQVILDSIGRGGVLIIPIFALERTQEVLYELNYLHESKQIPKVPIFLDSPLAIEAVEIYKHYVHLFDEAAKTRMKEGDDLFRFDGLEFTRTVEQSKKINKVNPPKVILAGSGMSNGGRILYHFKLYLSNPKTHVLIISYQAEGTLGRALRDGAKKILIDKEKIAVKAKVTALGSYSSHADQPKLLHWLKEISHPKPKKIFIIHGEEKSSLMLADGIRQKLKINPQIAVRGESYEI